MTRINGSRKVGQFLGKKCYKILLVLFTAYTGYWYFNEYRFFDKLPKGSFLESPASPYFRVKKPDFLIWNGEIEGIKEMGEFNLWRYEVVISKTPFSGLVIEERTIDKPFQAPQKIKKIIKTPLKTRIQELSQEDEKQKSYIKFMIEEMVEIYELAPQSN